MQVQVALLFHFLPWRELVISSDVREVPGARVLIPGFYKPSSVARSSGGSFRLKCTNTAQAQTLI